METRSLLAHAAWVFLGGGAGAAARFVVGVALMRLAGPGFPWGTLAVNLAGCLLIGLIAGFTAHRHAEGLTVAPFAGMDHTARLILVTGFLGGFTTFSAFGIETVDLLRLQQPGRAAAYVLASVVVGIALAWAGWRIGLRIAPPAPPLT
ncbi:MAG: fluoride efflux transporter CrcB [Phycisphaerales bacterium]